MNTFLAPSVRLNLDGIERMDAASALRVMRSIHEPVGLCELALSNAHFEWADAVQEGDALHLDLGWRGGDLPALFDGTVSRVIDLPDRLCLQARCRMERLSREKVTRTYSQEEAGVIVRHLVEGLGFESLDLDDCDAVLDHLALADHSPLFAIRSLTRRLRLAHRLFGTARGGLVWRPDDPEQAASNTFTFGVDIAGIQAVGENRLSLHVPGCRVDLGSIAKVVMPRGKTLRGLVESVSQTVGLLGRGWHTRLLLRNLGEAS